jgi:hypothetical protein
VRLQFQPEIMRLIRELAEYEKCLHEVHATEDMVNRLPLACATSDGGRLLNAVNERLSSSERPSLRRSLQTVFLRGMVRKVKRER